MVCLVNLWAAFNISVEYIYTLKGYEYKKCKSCASEHYIHRDPLSQGPCKLCDPAQALWPRASSVTPCRRWRRRWWWRTSPHTYWLADAKYWLHNLFDSSYLAKSLHKGGVPLHGHGGVHTAGEGDVDEGQEDWDGLEQGEVLINNTY